MKDPFWKRSIFGSFLFIASMTAVRYFVSGTIPTEGDWAEVIGLLLGVFGYQVGRPTGRVS